jgi:hypothetical protein
MPSLFPATVSSKSSSNVRSSASATSSILEKIGGAPMDCRLAKDVVLADGYEWLAIEINGLSGYVAKTASLIIQYAAETPKIPLYRLNLGFVVILMPANVRDSLAMIVEYLLKAIREAPEE